jgi:hypothetical protein
MTPSRAPSRAKAIYAYCEDCSGHSKLEARRCQLTDCPLHQFRAPCVRKGTGRPKPHLLGIPVGNTLIQRRPALRIDPTTSS